MRGGKMFLYPTRGYGAGGGRCAHRGLMLVETPTNGRGETHYAPWGFPREQPSRETANLDLILDLTDPTLPGQAWRSKVHE